MDTDLRHVVPRLHRNVADIFPETTRVLQLGAQAYRPWRIH